MARGAGRLILLGPLAPAGVAKHDQPTVGLNFPAPPLLEGRARAGSGGWKGILPNARVRVPTVGAAGQGINLRGEALLSVTRQERRPPAQAPGRPIFSTARGQACGPPTDRFRRAARNYQSRHTVPIVGQNPDPLGLCHPRARYSAPQKCARWRRPTRGPWRGCVPKQKSRNIFVTAARREVTFVEKKLCCKPSPMSCTCCRPSRRLNRSLPLLSRW